MHRTLDVQNAGIPEDQHFHLRAGVNAAMAWSDGLDIYGTGVNLAARLATLAGPGETIASASAHEQLAAALASLARPGETIGSATARDELTHGVDASCEDLANAFSSILTSRCAFTALARHVRTSTSPGGDSMELPCSRP